MNHHKWILAAIPLISVLAVGSSYAQSFYKWTDDQGATHYTQTSPPKKTVKKVTISTHIPQDSADEIKKLDDQSNKNLKTTADEEAAAKAKADAASDAERRKKNSAACQQLRNSQAQLQSGQRLRSVDANGQSTYLTEAQKSQKIIDQSIQMKNDCPN